MGGGGEGAVGLFELCNPHLLPTPVLQELLLPLHLRPQEREEVVRLARCSLPLTSHPGCRKLKLPAIHLDSTETACQFFPNFFLLYYKA